MCVCVCVCVYTYIHTYSRADSQRKQTTDHSNDKHCKIQYNLTMQLLCKWLSVINLDMRMYGSNYFIQSHDR